MSCSHAAYQEIPLTVHGTTRSITMFTLTHPSAYPKLPNSSPLHHIPAKLQFQITLSPILRSQTPGFLNHNFTWTSHLHTTDSIYTVHRSLFFIWSA